MFENREEYREVRREGFRMLGLGAAWWLAIVAFFVVVGAIWWGITVATAPMVGKGEQHIQLNSAENRTFQYQRFFDLDATIRTQVRNADKARKELAEFNHQTPQTSGESFSITETRNQLRANATGLAQLCQSNVQQYNNDAQEWTRQQFLDNKLPARFDASVCDDPSLLPAAATSRQ